MKIMVQKIISTNSNTLTTVYTIKYYNSVVTVQLPLQKMAKCKKSTASRVQATS